MSETFFIGDTHFGHSNILKYEPEARPFESVEQMNEVIIDRWNGVVGKHDKVYHLGDFCFGRASVEIASRLNGQKRLIMGNHDVYGASEYLKYFLSVHGVMFWERGILTHVPVSDKTFGKRAAFNVHGHTHSSHILDVDGNKHARYFNVSCENNDLAPLNADLIRERTREL